MNIPPFQFWKKWTRSCAAGELIGIAAAALLAVGYIRLFGEPSGFWSGLFNVLVMLLAGAIEGSLLGWFQWRVLRLKFPQLKLSDWMGYTIAVAVLGWAMGMIPTMLFNNAASHNQPTNAEVTVSTEPALWLVLLGAAALGLLLGALFGLFQWLALRRQSPNAQKWILGNAIGWSLAMFWIFLAASIPDASTPLMLVVGMGAAGGILAGLSVGAITGLFLLHIDPYFSTVEEDA